MTTHSECHTIVPMYGFSYIVYYFKAIVTTSLGPYGVMFWPHFRHVIINRSLSEGVLPFEWLKANVCPVYKGKGGNSNVCNYRPIYLLCVTSEVAERCIYNCIINPIRTFIYDFQHGFLKSRSTTTQLVKVFNDSQYVIDNNGQSDVLYLDLSKAFDTIPHDLLILKLKYHGFHGFLLKWLCSYLSRRQQHVF